VSLLLLGCTMILDEDIRAALAARDLDGDGHVSQLYGGDDCWDNPDVRPREATAVAGFDQPEASAVHPGAPDTWYDGVDQDCAGNNDFDADGDGFRTAWHADGAGQVGTDCYDITADTYPVDDACDAEGDLLLPAQINPDAEDAPGDGVDADCDGAPEFDADGDGSPSCEDCDEADASVYPGAVELCATEADDDCDGETNQADASGCVSYAADADGDGFGDPGDTRCLCEPDGPYDTLDATDCDDADDATFPGAAPGDSAIACMTDADGDGFGDAAATGDVEPGTDCDDADDATFPGAAPSDSAIACMTDADGDGYGDDAPASGVDAGTDCDDGDATVNPGVSGDPAGDEVDQNCTGRENCYNDLDDDGYAASDGSYTTGDDTDCDDPGEATDDVPRTDCDDGDASVNPAATEYCDGQDDDCDGIVDGDLVSLDDGAWSDLTADWTGTSAAPAEVTLPASGTVYVCAGTWYVGLYASGADLEVIGPGGSENTVLDGGDAVTVLEASGSTLAIEGLTFTGGSAGAGTVNYGGGVAIVDGSVATLSDVVIRDNASDAAAGGLYVRSSSVTLDSVEVSGNVAVTSGGGICASSGTLSLTNSMVTGNATDASGGGVWLYGDLAIIDSEITDNLAASNGGGVNMYSGSTFTCEDTDTSDGTDASVRDNAAAKGAGVFFDYASGTLESAGCDWSGNDIDGDYIGSYSYGEDETFSCDASGGCF
jgi:predicted outer membrane repeat protein